MFISIAIHLTLHIKIKKYKIKVEKSLKQSYNQFGHQKEKFVLRIDKMTASNFVFSSIVFLTFIFSNQIVNHINATHLSKLKDYPNYILVYWYYLAMFNINTFSAEIWYFIRTPKIKLTILRELKSVLRIPNLLNNES
jgi:hypothetical protein